MLQSALNSSPSPQRKHLAPVTIFAGHQPKPRVPILRKTSNAQVVQLSYLQSERLFNIKGVKNALEKVHPIV